MDITPELKVFISNLELDELDTLIHLAEVEIIERIGETRDEQTSD